MNSPQVIYESEFGASFGNPSMCLIHEWEEAGFQKAIVVVQPDWQQLSIVNSAEDAIESVEGEIEKRERGASRKLLEILKKLLLDIKGGKNQAQIAASALLNALEILPGNRGNRGPKTYIIFIPSSSRVSGGGDHVTECTIKDGEVLDWNPTDWYALSEFWGYNFVSYYSKWSES